MYTNEVISIGKILVIWFDDVEENVLNDITNAINSAKSYNHIEIAETHNIKIRDLEIVSQQRQVYKGGLELGLTYTEFEILMLFAKHPGTVFSKERLFKVLYREDIESDIDNIVYCIICSLRKKLEPDPRHPKYIHTVRGVGYKFEPLSEE